MLRQIRAHGAARELEVGLVNHDERVGGVEQLQDEAVVGQVARGVVRAGDDHVIDVALGHARKHRLLVDGVVGPTRHVHHLGVRQLRVVLVHRKRRRHVEELAPRAAVGQRDVEQQLIAAVAQKHLVAVKPVGCGYHVTQLVGQRVGIAVEGDLVQLALHFLANFRSDVGRVLVRRKIRLGRQVLRVVGRDVGQLRGRCANAIHPHPPSRRCCRFPPGSCAARRCGRAPTGPRGGRWRSPRRRRWQEKPQSTG